MNLLFSLGVGMIAFVLAYLVISTIRTFSTRRNGGIRFYTVGPYGGTFYRRRAR